jgi:hypothetical protein
MEVMLLSSDLVGKKHNTFNNIVKTLKLHLKPLKERLNPGARVGRQGLGPSQKAILKQMNPRGFSKTTFNVF